MRRRVLFWMLVAGSLTVTLAVAGQAFQSKPWKQWTEKDAFRLLEDSPWTGEQGSGQITVQITWRSARPVRLAVARLAQLRQPELTEEQLRQVVDSEASREHYVIALEPRAHPSRIPASDPPRLQDAFLGFSLRDLKQELETMTIERFKNTTYLVTPGKPKVWAVGYLSPLDVGGDAGLFLFPRFDGQGNPHFDEGDAEIRLISSFQEINKAFKTRKMVWEGELAL